MHKLLTLAGAATIALSSAGLAADLPSRAPPPVVYAPPIFTWTGFYVGVNLGWGWRQNNDNGAVFLDPTIGPGLVGLNGTVFFPGIDDNAFTGGGQIGYNYQIGSFVVGLEADIQGIDNGGNNDVLTFVPGAGFAGNFVPGVFTNDTSDWWGSVRARLGFAIDRVLIYGTGGWAFTDNNSGWAAGAGVEWALPVNWFGSSAVTLGLEGLWVSIDRGNDGNGGFVGTFTPIGGPTVSVFAPVLNNNDDEFFVARAKLNFKF
jgi:outer membrane immunogenic protein